MNKMISFVLALFMVLSSAAFADDSAYITRSETVRNIVQRMYDEGGSVTFPFAELYSIHASGYLHFAPSDTGASYPLLCEINKNVEGSGFADVSAEHDSAVFITLAKRMGIVNGYDDTQFCPDNEITHHEAVKMLICGLGYGDRAFYNGGYPDGYMRLADELGITNGMEFLGDEKINSQTFSQLLQNSYKIQGYPMRNIMMYFTMPNTAEDCINTFAKAAQERRGAIQYALFTDEKQTEINESFQGLMWMSGASSPWVTGFDIHKEDDLNYKIIFHYATSTGPERDQTVNLQLKPLNGIYKIANAEVSE